MKLLLVIFFIFALSRAVLRFRDGHINTREMVVLALFWTGATIVALWPATTSLLATLLGVGRGADAVLYLTVALLCYLQFRNYIHMRDVELQLTRLVRQMALSQVSKPSQAPKSPPL